MDTYKVLLETHLYATLTQYISFERCPFWRCATQMPYLAALNTVWLKVRTFKNQMHRDLAYSNNSVIEVLSDQTSKKSLNICVFTTSTDL